MNSLTLGATAVENRPPVAASDDAIHMEAALALHWQGQYFANMPLTLKARPDKNLTIRAVFIKHQEAAS